MNGVSNGKNNLLKYYDVNILITLFDLCSWLIQIKWF
jgi:hypothetical protein